MGAPTFQVLEDPATPQGGQRSNLPRVIPALDNEWDILQRPAKYGAVQTRLAKLEAMVGRTPLLKLHSFRSFLPTCASQLNFSRENREALGRWRAGSLMPDRYGRAACVTELRLRNSVLEQFARGWRPSLDLEVAPKNGTEGEGSVASETSVMSSEPDIGDLSASD